MFILDCPVIYTRNPCNVSLLLNYAVSALGDPKPWPHIGKPASEAGRWTRWERNKGNRVLHDDCLSNAKRYILGTFWELKTAYDCLWLYFRCRVTDGEIFKTTCVLCCVYFVCAITTIVCANQAIVQLNAHSGAKHNDSSYMGQLGAPPNMCCFRRLIRAVSSDLLSHITLDSWGSQTGS